MELPSMILKRDGSAVEFKTDKIERAIELANKGVDGNETIDEAEVLQLVLGKVAKVSPTELSVEHVHDFVEEALIECSYAKTAKAYILHRDKKARERKPDIFKKRLALKPYEYPELMEYVDAIRESYWIHTEFSYTGDIQDYKVNVDEAGKNAITNAMLAIAQVEVAVKTFWGNIYDRMPKPEIGSVGATFSESEVRHHDAYSHLLEILGLNNEFEKIKDIPALMQRVTYLDKSTATAKTGEDKDFALAVMLFSLFIEHVSLFSQFLVIMSFNKHTSMFKGISNAIEATSKEEQIHGLFGIDLINIIREEKPEWFDEDMEKAVYAACRESYVSEEQVIDWIFEKGDLDFLTAQTVKEFVKDRLNNSLESVGYERIFEVDEAAIDTTEWFNDEVIATKHVDFFNKRSINYTKRSASFAADDLF